MSADLLVAIKDKFDKIAEDNPRSKVTIFFDGKMQAQIDAVMTYAKKLGLEVMIEKKENISEALEEAAKAHTVTFDIREAEDIFEREICFERLEIKPLQESCWHVFDEQKAKSKQREHMKQMQRYQNKHWRK